VRFGEAVWGAWRLARSSRRILQGAVPLVGREGIDVLQPLEAVVLPLGRV